MSSQPSRLFPRMEQSIHVWCCSNLYKNLHVEQLLITTYLPFSLWHVGTEGLQLQTTQLHSVYPRGVGGELSCPEFAEEDSAGGGAVSVNELKRC
ncbi:hypothetical protein AVEN_4667-1 [Araneus ventricosus]|uniref:Uncharacterized protein n=1 Tax=Araneus ventricosus TaxID=182803 RepID=A0A4Y2I1Q7_ARAVE|nr:hypothetical protein AVEN_4667-1 [Araneus ventricosus]